MPKRTRFGFYLPGEDGRSVFVPKGTPHSAALAKKLEGNPDAFEEYDDQPVEDEAPPAPPETPETDEGPEPAPAADPDAAPEPPAGNASTGEWRAFAEAVGVEVDEDAGRDDIKAQLTERGLLS